MVKIFYRFCKYQGQEVIECVINTDVKVVDSIFIPKDYITMRSNFSSPHKFDIFQQQLTFLCKSLTFKVWHWELLVPKSSPAERSFG